MKLFFFWPNLRKTFHGELNITSILFVKYHFIRTVIFTKWILGIYLNYTCLPFLSPSFLLIFSLSLIYYCKYCQYLRYSMILNITLQRLFCFHWTFPTRASFFSSLFFSPYAFSGLFLLAKKQWSASVCGHPVTMRVLQQKTLEEREKVVFLLGLDQIDFFKNIKQQLSSV